MYQTGGTIRKTLDAIHQHKFVLPAIQREFVWRPGQICRLFDSLMQGYPIGTFLYWQVGPENSNRFKFYDFVLDYHQRDKPHCPLLPPPPIPNQPLTVQLVSSFGFNSQTLTTRNAILPIAYYLFLKNPGDAYVTHSRFEQDREAIRKWLIKSLLKSSISGSGSDTLLTAHRRVIRESRENGDKEFPVARIHEEMAGRRRSLAFEESELENLANMRYGDRRMFALLSLLFPFVDLRNQFHIDHIFPRARFTERRLASAGVPREKIDDFIQRKDLLANLQLLQGAENNEKRATMPNEWLRQSYPEPTRRQEYLDRHLLEEVPDSITEFDAFYEARRERLKAKIKQLLGK